jgi:hypothetical protein
MRGYSIRDLRQRVCFGRQLQERSNIPSQGQAGFELFQANRPLPAATKKLARTLGEESMKTPRVQTGGHGKSWRKKAGIGAESTA